MIYLDEKLNALDSYSEVNCWLGVKIKGRLTKVNPNGYSCGKKPCIYCLGSSKRRSGLTQDFRDLFNAQLIRELINGKPDILAQIYRDLSTIYIAKGYSLTNFNEQGSMLFVDSGYTDWFLGNKWNYKIAKKLDQHTCTYCNREYIFVYEKKGKGMVPQFDHWFSKTDFPLLALSFYNLVPSCATCNTIKSATKFNLSSHLHPYVDKNIASSYSFSYLPISTTSNKIIFQNKSINSKSIDTINALNLPLIYQGHSSKELQDLIDLKYKYSKSYLNVLLEKTFADLKLSEQERYRLIFGIEIDEDKFHKRILSKFKKDIITELLSRNR